MEEVLNPHGLVKAEAVGLECELDALLGEEVGEGEHLKLQVFEKLIAQVQHPLLEGQGHVLVEDQELMLGRGIGPLDPDQVLVLQLAHQPSHPLENLQLLLASEGDALADQRSLSIGRSFLQLAEGVAFLHDHQRGLLHLFYVKEIVVQFIQRFFAIPTAPKTSERAGGRDGNHQGRPFNSPAQLKHNSSIMA